MAKIPPLRSTGYISDLARSPLLDRKVMSPVELVVYLRLLGRSCDDGEHFINPTNEELKVDRRTASRVLKKLVRMKFIAVTYTPHRVIQVF